LALCTNGKQEISAMNLLQISRLFRYVPRGELTLPVAACVTR